jgi:hypothetical protein
VDQLASPTLLSIIVTLVIASSVAIGLSARSRRPTIQAFFWANSSISPLISPIIILCSSYSLNGILYQVWLGYSIGWISLLTQLLWSCGFVFLAVKFSKFSGLINVGSMHGILGSIFNQSTQHLAAIASVIGFSLLIGWEVSVGVSVFSGLIGGGLQLSIILSYMLVIASIIYTTQSGLRGNVRVNTLNNLLKTIGLLLPLVVIVASFPNARSAVLSWTSYKTSWVDTKSSIESLTVIGLLVNLFFSFSWQMVDMTVWQNLAATKEGKKKGILVLIIAAVLAFIFPGVVGTVMGVALTPTANLTSDNIMFAFYETSLVVPFMGILFLMACGCAILTTIDGYSLAVGQAFTWDVLDAGKVRELLALGKDRDSSDNDQTVVDKGRIVILVSTVLGVTAVVGLVHGFGKSVFDVVYFVIIAQMSLLPVMLACVTERASASAIGGNGARSIAGGLGLGFVCAIVGLVGSIDSLYMASPLIAAAAGAIILYGWPAFITEGVIAGVGGGFYFIWRLWVP